MRIAKRNLDSALSKYNADLTERGNQVRNYKETLKSQLESIDEQIRSNFPKLCDGDNELQIKLNYIDFTQFVEDEPIPEDQTNSEIEVSIYKRNEPWAFEFIFEYDTHKFRAFHNNSGFATINIKSIFNYNTNYTYTYITESQIATMEASCNKFMYCANTVKSLQEFDWDTLLSAPENKLPLFEDYVKTVVDHKSRDKAETSYLLSVIQKIVGTDFWLGDADGDVVYNFTEKDSDGNIFYVKFYLPKGYDTDRDARLQEFNYFVTNHNMGEYYRHIDAGKTTSDLGGVYIHPPIDLFSEDDIRDFITGSR